MFFSFYNIFLNRVPKTCTKRFNSDKQINIFKQIIK